MVKHLYNIPEELFEKANFGEKTAVSLSPYLMPSFYIICMGLLLVS